MIILIFYKIIKFCLLRSNVYKLFKANFMLDIGNNTVYLKHKIERI